MAVDNREGLRRGRRGLGAHLKILSRSNGEEPRRIAAAEFHLADASECSRSRRSEMLSSTTPDGA
jgi:hypothetical protein